jgi:transposase-like protein
MPRRDCRVPASRSSFAGVWFPPEVIMVAVRWYLRYGLSYRDVEQLLGERGIAVDRVSIYRWVQRFTPLLIDAARSCRHTCGDRWFVDETYVKVSGRWIYLYRAIDQFGQVIDVLVSEKRDLVATRRFFTRALEHGPHPSEVTTDRAPAYPRVLNELLPGACTSWSNTPITPSSPIMDGSKPDAADAWPETARFGTSDQYRARILPESPPRSLRTRYGQRPTASAPGGLHRTRVCHLITASSG